MIENIFLEKKKYGKALKNFFKFPLKSNRPNGLIIIKDQDYIDFLLDGLEILSCDFVIKTQKEINKKLNVVGVKDIKKDLLIGFDFVLLDNETESLKDFFKNAIIPIVPVNNYLSTILKEFDPLNSEGNCFLYQDNNKRSMYYAIIRYLENYKFPYDNRTLVKNIISL